MNKNQHLTSKIYFENLNAIRFIAACFVIVLHVEQIKIAYHFPSRGVSRVVTEFGRLGVNLFFVLSGFLISYLLFKEKELTQTIHVKNFYIRRVLRIWPLYYLIIVASFFIFPFIGFFTMEGFDRAVVWRDLPAKLLLYILFLPNLVVHVFGFIPYAAQTWTIGAEEQFYFVWPILNKRVKNKWVLMFGVIFFYLLVKFSIPLLPSNRVIDIFKSFWNYMPIDMMAIGGVFALLIYENNANVVLLRKLLFSKTFQIVILLITVVCIYKGFAIPYFHYEMYGVLFGILICNFAANKDRVFSMENIVTNYLGKISYGLYMYNPVAIILSLKLLQYLKITNNYLIYTLSFLLVISIATISYEFFEKRFIRKKVHYSEIISGDEANPTSHSQDSTRDALVNK